MDARPPNRIWKGRTSIERAFVGAGMCCLAVIPLAIGYSLYGYSTYGDWSLIYVIGGTAAVLAVALVITGLSAVCFGVSLFEDPEGTLLFAFFGLYSGAAFWFGADVLVRSKPPERSRDTTRLPARGRR